MSVKSKSLRLGGSYSWARLAAAYGNWPIRCPLRRQTRWMIFRSMQRPTSLPIIGVAEILKFFIQGSVWCPFSNWVLLLVGAADPRLVWVFTCNSAPGLPTGCCLPLMQHWIRWPPVCRPGLLASTVTKHPAKPRVQPRPSDQAGFLISMLVSHNDCALPLRVHSVASLVSHARPVSHGIMLRNNSRTTAAVHSIA